MKRIIAMLLLVVMAFSLAACGQTAAPAEETDPAEETAPVEDAAPAEEATEEPAASKYQTTYGSKMFDNVTITVELWDRSNAPEDYTITDSWLTNYVQTEMAKVGINVEFVSVPRGEETEKMQIMMASQTAPDITITYMYANAEQYYNDGGTWDLSQFVDGEDQAQNLKAYIGEDCLDTCRNADGALFGITARRTGTEAANGYIRKDWLDKLGLEIPTTVDELYNCIEKMVNENPDGRDDVIGAEFKFYYNLPLAFSTIMGDEVATAVANPSMGTSDPIRDYADPGSREYYRFVNKLYNAGLMHQEYYTLDNTARKELLSNGTIAYIEAENNYIENNGILDALAETWPEAEYVSIPSLINVNDGNQYSVAYTQGGLTCICPLTASEEEVEACVTYLDWLCTEEAALGITWGEYGYHWEYDDAGIRTNIGDGSLAEKDIDWCCSDMWLVGNGGYYQSQDERIKQTIGNAASPKKNGQRKVDNWANSASGIIVRENPWNSAAQTEYVTDLGLVKDEYRVKCITCAADEFDAMWDEYMAALEDAGMTEVIAERTEHYEAIYNK